MKKAFQDGGGVGLLVRVVAVGGHCLLVVVPGHPVGYLDKQIIHLADPFGHGVRKGEAGVFVKGSTSEAEQLVKVLDQLDRCGDRGPVNELLLNDCEGRGPTPEAKDCTARDARAMRRVRADASLAATDPCSSSNDLARNAQREDPESQ